MRYARKIILCLLIGVMTFSLAACGSSAKTFEGEAKGKNGIIKVKVSIKDQKITKIDVVENHESDFTKDTFKKVIENIIEENSTEIDAVSGATVTSSAIIAAVKDAVKKSGIELKSKKGSDSSSKLENTTTDVVVIGAGGAGLTASIEAKEKGAKVILVEKTAVIGGNTNFATGGLNATETKYQKEKGIKDSVKLFIDDTMKGGKNKNNPELVKKLAEKSSETVDWLTERGADLSDVGIMGGASVKRTHRPEGGAPVGNHLVKVLEKKAKELKIDMRTETKATELIVEDNKVVGVKVKKGDKTYEIKAKSVILAMGGFGANSDMVVKYRSELEGFGTTNGPGATGDVVKLVEKLNVELVDMKEIQSHPTVVPGKSKLITEAVRGNGAILVNRDGKRFINELETRDVVSKAELQQKGKTAFLIFDQNVRESLKAIEGYAKAGVMKEAESIKELGGKIDINVAELEKTVNKYNSYAKAKKDADFKRADMKFELNKAKYYAIEVGPAVHHTMGGVKINTNAEVMNKSGKVIEGLYAAGEVTGGVHGANRLGGNAVADITVYGRIAGENAAKAVKK